MSVFTGKVVNGAESPQSGDNTNVLRILVVEDEERLARLISRVLSEEGYAVETEANGRQALVRALAGLSEKGDGTSCTTWCLHGAHRRQRRAAQPRRGSRAWPQGAIRR